jgi:hypothetical protein
MGVGCEPAAAGSSFLVVRAAVKFGRMALALALVVAAAGCARTRTGAPLDVYRDIPAGPHKLYFSRPMEMFRGSHQEFAATAGRTYYFRLEYNDKGKWISASTIVAGAAGALVSSAVSAAADDRGLFDFTALDETAARAAMAELRLAE